MPNLTLSTAATIQIGPFVDKTDGITAETGLTPVVELSKAGAVYVARNSGDAVAHDTEGWYRIPLDTTDTNTLGSLIVKAYDVANHVYVWRELDVVSEQDEVIHIACDLGVMQTAFSQRITVGPFISKSTKLPLTSLTVANITSGVIKWGSPPTNTAITWAAAATDHDMTHLANGYWICEITSTDTNTLGRFRLTFRDDDVFYPVTATGMVVNKQFSDSMITAGAALEVNVTEWLGTSVATPTTAGVPEVDLTHIAGNAADATDFAASINNADQLVDVNVVQISDDATAADNLETACDGGSYNIGGGGAQVDVTKISGDSTAADRLEALMDGSPVYTVDDTAFAPTTAAFETDATEATADHYIDGMVIFTSGSLLGARKLVTDYVLSGGRGKFTVDAFVNAPANGDTFIIV